jgi:hypothetical protein
MWSAGEANDRNQQGVDACAFTQMNSRHGMVDSYDKGSFGFWSRLLQRLNTVRQKKNDTKPTRY